MTSYGKMSTIELEAAQKDVMDEYASFKAKNLKLNMARGKPSSSQLDLSMPLLDVLNSSSQYKNEEGIDCRNYGVLDGLAEAKNLMGFMLDEDPQNVIIYGNASLNLMYDTFAHCFSFGILGSKPWSTYEEIKWICPVPGYDRHFSITEYFGCTMIPVSMTEEGPDMDEIEKLVISDPSIKGIWCVPKYSNPDGISYSNEVVTRLASMECAADDFRIFWDNAYSVHHLYEDASQQDQLLDIGDACEKAGNPHRYFKFASTSKVTFPGSGISAYAASAENLHEMKKRMGVQTIGHDKMNQLRHALFLKDAEGLTSHMAKHAAILRPKFELVFKKLEQGLQENDCGSWTTPQGGYFVSFYAPHHTAKRIVDLAREAGVVMTGAGATYPYGKDPDDSNIRIAPTFPPLEELDIAMDVFVCCVKIATIEKLLQQ